VKKRKPAAPPPEPKVTDDRPLKHAAFKTLASMKDALAADELAKEKHAREAADAKKRAAAARPPMPDAAGSAKGRMTTAADVWRPDLDRDLFRVAMSGVVKLAEGKSHAREMPRGGAQPNDATGVSMRRARAEGGDVIPVRWNEDGTFAAARPARLFALEALDRFATIEHRLDLHGSDATTAVSRVGEFVRTRRERGARVVAIVHGTGKHAPDGESVLRDVVVKTLSEPPASRDVDAFRSADRRDGGAGVTIVALRAR
jgi:DNA-nicking Smr family endonuclease